jgi:protein involved in polysaccharide export with SLBB domain
MLKRILVLATLFAATVAFAQEPARIKAGDTVRMTCEEEPTLNKEYAVTAQGMILVDFLGAVKVAGLTEPEAARLLADRLLNERILRQATVRVKIVTTTVAPITYKGAAKATGQEPFREGLRLSDIVRKAQPTDDTDLSRIEVRGAAGPVFVDFTKFDPATNANNPLLKPGDTVTFVVKTAPGFVVLLGGVERPGGVTWEQGMTVRSAIEKAGGFSSLALNTNVKLERDGKPTQTLDLSRNNVNAAVLEGDRIIVSMRAERQYVVVSGAVVKGGFIEFVPGMTLTKAVANSGGLRGDANPSVVRLTRKGQEKSVTYSFEALSTGKAPDPVLNAGDKVMVEAKRTSKTDILKTITVIALLYILIGR